MYSPGAVPTGANGSSLTHDAIRGSYNFGTPTTPKSPEVPTRVDLSPLPTNNSVFEVQVLERLSKLQRQQQTDAETLLNVVDSRTSQLVNRLTILEKTVANLLPEGPEADLLPPPVEEPPVETGLSLHSSLSGFSLENLVRINLFNRIHFNDSAANSSAAGPRGKIEVRPDDLRWGVRDGLEKLDDGEKLELLTEYVQLFLRTRTFAMPKSVRKKYPKADFQAMGQFFSNASRALNSLISSGIVE